MSIEAFLAGIRENPDDLERRLVFADWLDDHGDPERADLVRRQTEAEQLLAILPDPEVSPFARHIRQALQPPAALVARWFGELPSSVELSFRGGLLALRLRGAAAPLPAPLEEAIRQGWVGELHLHFAADQLDALGARPWLIGCAPRLHLHGELDRALARWGEGIIAPLERIRHLGLHHRNRQREWLTRVGAAAPLFSWDRPLPLESLELENCFGPGAWFRDIASSLALQQLHTLKINDCESGTQAFRALAGCDGLRQLRHLSLVGSAPAEVDIAALANAPAMALVNSLTLSGPNIAYGELVLSTLARTDWSQRLERLRLSGMGVRRPAVRGLERLESLDLLDCMVSVEDLCAILEWLRPRGLKHMAVQGGPAISDQDCSRVISALCRASSLRSLVLDGCDVGDDTIEALADSEEVRELRYLDLSGNRVGHRGAAAIAFSSRLGKLEALSLGGCLPSDAAERALAASPQLPRLRYLDPGSGGPHETMWVVERHRWQEIFSQFPPASASAQQRVSGLLQLLTSPADPVRLRAAGHLGDVLANSIREIPPSLFREASDRLVDALADTRTFLRSSIAPKLLGLLQARDTPLSPARQAILIEVLRDPDPQVHRHFARVLQRIPLSPEVLPQLREMLNDPSTEVSRHAAAILQRYQG